VLSQVLVCMCALGACVHGTACVRVRRVHKVHSRLFCVHMCVHLSCAACVFVCIALRVCACILCRMCVCECFACTCLCICPVLHVLVCITLHVCILCTMCMWACVCLCALHCMCVSCAVLYVSLQIPANCMNTPNVCNDANGACTNDYSTVNFNNYIATNSECPAPPPRV